MKKSEMYPFFVIKSVLRCFCEIRFGEIYALLRGENFVKNLVGGEKMTNIRYATVCQLLWDGEGCHL